jgi:hypothetical protein
VWRWGSFRGVHGAAVRPRPGRDGAWPGDRRGLALLVMVFAIVIVAAVASVGYLAAAEQFRVSIAGRQGNAAFYAAEAGLGAGLSRWDSTIVTLQPGATRRLASGRLSSGAAFEVRLTRIDEGLDDVAHYLMVSTGRARGPWGGRRRVALFLRARRLDAACCAAALTTRGDLSVADAAVISGFDRVPEAWASLPATCAPGSSGSGPGVLFLGEGSLTEAPGAAVLGQPATRRLSDGRPNLLSSAERWFVDLPGLADHHLPAGAVLERIEPALGSQRTCDRDAPWNWGAPDDPDHPCFEYLPIIHSEGDVQITAPGSGQGVLLVEGNLEIDDGFQFFGVIVVRGTLTVRGAASRVYGAVIVLNAERARSEVTSGARIDLSRCPLRRALRGPKLYLPHPLAEFAWLEILE